MNSINMVFSGRYLRSRIFLKYIVFVFNGTFNGSSEMDITFLSCVNRALYKLNSA